VGRHLAAAGEGIEAAPLLAGAARERLAICDYEEVHELARLRDSALAAAGVAASDPCRGLGYVLRAEAAVSVGRLEESEAWVRRAEAAADEAIAAEVTQLRARAALRRARNDEAASLYREGLARMERVGNAIGAADCLHGWGEAEKLLGQLERSYEHHEAALAICEREGDTLFANRVRMGLADVLRRLERLDEAVDMLVESVDAARCLGNASAVATGLNTLGDIARARGQLEEADRHYRESMAELEALASDEATIARLNLGLVQLARERWSEARATFEAARPELEGSDRRGYLAFVLAGLWVCDAGEAAWDPFDERALALEALLTEVPVFDDDLAWCAAEAARRAHDAKEHARAAIADRLCAAQREALGR
jgi:tetratricopeptide (TPR) repeat protein